MEHGIDYDDRLGNNIPGKITLPVTDADHCARLCAEEAACKVWTVNQDTLYCYLKTSTSGRRPDANAISGSKACGGKPLPCPSH